MKQKRCFLQIVKNGGGEWVRLFGCGLSVHEFVGSRSGEALSLEEDSQLASIREGDARIPASGLDHQHLVNLGDNIL